MYPKHSALCSLDIDNDSTKNKLRITLGLGKLFVN